jgi:hypothetical protein
MWMRRFVRLVWAVLKELSDERAYERHLAREGRTHSPEEWRKFSECRFHHKYRRARCC